jgi:hypothetical protein
VADHTHSALAFFFPTLPSSWAVPQRRRHLLAFLPVYFHCKCFVEIALRPSAALGGVSVLIGVFERSNYHHHQNKHETKATSYFPMKCNTSRDHKEDDDNGDVVSYSA